MDNDIPNQWLLKYNGHKFLTIFKFCRFACSLLRQGMKQIIINSETPGIKALEKAGDKSAVDEVIVNSFC